MSEAWLGREDLAWNILLAVEVAGPPTAEELGRRLAALCEHQGWPAPAPVLEAADLDDLVEQLSDVRDAGPVSVARSDAGLVVRGHHAHVDGLGLLAVLRDMLGEDVFSSAGGVSGRSSRSTIATMAERLLEAVARPPAGIAGRPGDGAAHVDVFARTTVPRPVRTAEVAQAAVGAVCARNEAHAARGTRVALAIGVSLVGGHELRVGDDSGFLRLPGVERHDQAALTLALARAPLQVGGTARSGAARRAGPLIRWASRVLAARLGSTLLVSHLGRVEARGVTGLAFYPLAGNGSGVSLGAASVAGETVLTLRARRSEHATSDVDDLLAAIARRLDQDPA